MEIDGVKLTDSQRLRYLADDLYDHAPAWDTESDLSEPRRYAPDPAKDYVADLAGDLELVKYTRLSHETILDYPLSRSIAYARRTQREARRREIVRYGLWCIGWAVIVGTVLYLVSVVGNGLLTLAGVA